METSYKSNVYLTDYFVDVSKDIIHVKTQNALDVKRKLKNNENLIIRIAYAKYRDAFSHKSCEKELVSPYTG
jgi:hypothetical protein